MNTNIYGLDGSGSTNNPLVVINFLYSCLLDVVFVVQLRGRWPMHTQNACFWHSSPKKIIGQSTCLVRVFAFVSQCNELANCYCYAIVKREICLGHS